MRCSTVEYVVRRERLNLPLPGNGRISEHNSDVEVVAFHVVANFSSRAPVECDGDDLEVTGIPPATQPVQVARTGRANLHHGAKK